MLLIRAVRIVLCVWFKRADLHCVSTSLVEGLGRYDIRSCCIDRSGLTTGEFMSKAFGLLLKSLSSPQHCCWC